MINSFDIQHFKSVKNVHLDCRRINLFIGEPNTGKSNILEALGFLSCCAHGGELRDYVRFDKSQDLFYDGLVEQGAWKLKVTGNIKVPPKNTYEMIKAAANDAGTQLQELRELTVSANYTNGWYVISALTATADNATDRLITTLDAGGRFTQFFPLKELEFINFYRFKQLTQSPYLELGPLRPPDGLNIVALVFSSKELRRLVSEFFNPYGLQLVIKPQEHKFEIQKQSEGIVFSFPFHLSSDTLQRMVFYTVAIESNKESTLVFEEPEAHAFPYFTKHLGERVALDENKNQYFIATHNPYLLAAIVEKAPANEVAVFVTYYRDYETRVKSLNKEALSRLFEADPFLGIEQFIEEKE